MRIVEYIIITDKIENISEFYRSVGVLQYTGESSIYAPDNVFAGAEIIQNSPFVNFEDRRRGVSGVLRDVQNADIRGISNGWTSQLKNQYAHAAYAGLTVHTDVFFYGELLSKEFTDTVPNAGSPAPFLSTPNIELTFRVDDILTGYPEHIHQGRGENIMMVRYILSYEERGYMLAALAHYRTYGYMPYYVPTAISNMVIGQRYFMRAAFRFPWMTPQTFPLPYVGSSVELLAVVPLNLDISIRRRSLDSEPIWYHPVDFGQTVDFASIPELNNVPDTIERLVYQQSQIYLLTTVDMWSLPIMQRRFPHIELMDGRFLTRDDYLSANNVVVVHELFAQIRNFELGDTIVIDVPQEQLVVGIDLVMRISDIEIVTIPGESTIHELEFTIVGFFRETNQLYYATHYSNYIFVPDSALPDDFVFSATMTDESRFRMGSISAVRDHRGDFLRTPQEPSWKPDMLEAIGNPDFLPHFWYSFVLHDSRDQSVFLFEYRDILETHGFNVRFLGVDSELFWYSAEPILQAVTMNVVVFSTVLILVLVLVVFLFLRQRQKEFAIMRALGVSAGKVRKQFLVSISFFGIPAIALGSVIAWLAAIDRAENTINPFGEIVTHIPLDLEVTVSLAWLPSIALAIFAILLVMTLFGAGRLERHSILRIIQGSVEAPVKKASTSYETSNGEFNVIQKFDGGFRHDMSFQKAEKPHGTFRFVLRHIVRARAKSILTTAVALFFVITLTFFTEMIIHVTRQIDHLYDNTIVFAEVREVNRVNAINARRFEDIIRLSAVENILGSNFTYNELAVANYIWTLVVPVEESGEPPYTWLGHSYADTKGGTITFEDDVVGLLAINCISRFLVAHSIDSTLALDEEWFGEIIFQDGVINIDNSISGEQMLARVNELEIDFAMGLDETAFEFIEGNPIPIIMREDVKTEHAISFGDMIYLQTWNARIRAWDNSPAVIIGVHNGKIADPFAFRNAVIMPLDAGKHIFNQKGGASEISFSTLAFDIVPAYNRELLYVEEELRAIIRRGGAGWTALMLVLHDEELRIVVGSMEQNLSLMQLLYPVAITVSIVIGAGLALLLMLQNAKNAAIMRVLGSTKNRTRVVLWIEQLAVCLIGLIIGLAAAFILGWGVLASVMLAGLYLAGVVIGSIVGSVLVTSKPPLELLQVKE